MTNNTNYNFADGNNPFSIATYTYIMRILIFMGTNSLLIFTVDLQHFNENW